MTIEKGSDWGEPWDEHGAVAPVEVDGDAELAALVDPAAGSPPVATVNAGDLLRTLGLDRPRPAGERHRYPIDAVVARLRRPDGAEIDACFVAHLTVRNRPLTGIGPGLSLAVMNAAWLGPLRLGPRAHPNDGVVDVTEGTVGLLQRPEANRRAASGAHLPHPQLRTRRGATWETSWSRPVAVWLDGVERGRFDAVRVEVHPDALALVV
ncbi:MAG: hypothetical protein AAGA93_10330 [Actinomycetota bacterium]